jgi:hypothetical protein
LKGLDTLQAQRRKRYPGECFVFWFRYRKSSKTGFSEPVDTAKLDSVSFADIVRCLPSTLLDTQSEGALKALLDQGLYRTKGWTAEFVLHRGWTWVSFGVGGGTRIVPMRYLTIRATELDEKLEWMKASHAAIAAGTATVPDFHFDALWRMKDKLLGKVAAPDDRDAWRSVAALLAQQAVLAQPLGDALAAGANSTASSMPTVDVLARLADDVKELEKRAGDDAGVAVSLALFDQLRFDKHATRQISKKLSEPCSFTCKSSGNQTTLHLFYFPASSNATTWQSFLRRHPTAFMQQFLQTVCGSLELGVGCFMKLLFLAHKDAATAAVLTCASVFRPLTPTETVALQSYAHITTTARIAVARYLLFIFGTAILAPRQDQC